MVRVQIQTHRIVELDSASESPNGSNSSTLPTPPGLTTNDARLAINIEKLFSDIYLTDGRGRLHVQSPPKITPASIDDIQKVASS